MNKSQMLGKTGLIALFSICLLATSEVKAQRKPAAGAKKPAATQAKKPATATQVKKPATTQAKKPSTTVNKPTATKSGTSGVKPTATKSAPGNGDGRNVSNNGDRQIGDNNSNNRNTNISGNKNVSGNNVNINVDNSKDIHVNNNRNTVVRRNTYRPYPRPPYVYGGYRYRCYHPYVYHPFRPFVWGPMWHPWGFFVATLATTAIIVSFADADLPPVAKDGTYWVVADNTSTWASLAKVQPGSSILEPEQFASLPFYQAPEDEYYYDAGVFYLKEKGGYTAVPAPVGAVIKTLPSGYETVTVDDASGLKNYYWGGTFYEKTDKGYKVVPPTSGVVIEHISEGAEEVKMGDITYVKLGQTYYQPIQQDGKNMYEVVDMEEDK